MSMGSGCTRGSPPSECNFDGRDRLGVWGVPHLKSSPGSAGEEVTGRLAYGAMS